MAISRRVLLATTALALVPTIRSSKAAGLVAEFEDYEPEPSSLSAGSSVADEVIVTAEGTRIVRFGNYGGNGSDQWPMAPVTAQQTRTEADFIGAHGDGIGLADDPSIPNTTEKRDFGFTRARFYISPQKNFRVRTGTSAIDDDLVDYNAPSNDDYKPNAIFLDQNNGDLHCFIARGDDTVTRRRAWLLTSAPDGGSWKSYNASGTASDPSGLPALPGGFIFDATTSNGLTPVGACNRPEGAVHSDGKIYLYFNKQGNLKSDFLYPSGNPSPQYKPVYCARIAAPSGIGSRGQRHNYFKNVQNYSFRTASGWSSSGDIAAARPIASFSEYMGKHFLVWWNPKLSLYVAARTHTLHYIWLGVSDKPWGPFDTVLDRTLGNTGLREELKFTAQLLPHPWFEDADGIRFPLAISGAPFYDCLGIAKIKFKPV